MKILISSVLVNILQVFFIVGGKEMAFRNFIYTENDDDLAFLPRSKKNPPPPPEFGTKMITADLGESPKASVFYRHPDVEPALKRGIKTREVSSSSHIVRAKPSASKDNAHILSIFDDDEGLLNCFELKDANTGHLKITAITSPAWKAHLDNQMDLELLDLHECCYARHAVVDNAVNRRASAMAEFKQNPIVLALQEKISSLTVDVKEYKGNLDRMMLESQKWACYLSALAFQPLSRRLVGTLVSSAITYGRCRAYEQVAAMNEPFDLSKAKGYRSSYKKEHTQASNDFATAMYPWLDKFVADAAAPIEALLSKKPPTLQKPSPSRTQMPVPSSQKATPSSTPSSNPISPPADLVKPFPSPFK
ncbi:hypothetical protein Tco_1338048 [Tanacetum coccineum]